MGTYRVIPIFIPQKACPFRCAYCNQFAIAGQDRIPMPEEVDGIIRQHLSTMGGDCHIRIAFFGGSFTGMSIEEQNQYLDIAFPYVQNGTVEGIQLSTRPDYITPEILDNLKCHGVSLIELGAQSLDDEVLQAAKYCPYLEIMFGPSYEVIPVLVLTGAHDFFDFVQIGKTDAVLPVCSGDMLFNVFDEYLGFLEK